MTTALLRNICIVLFFTACSSAARNAANRKSGNSATTQDKLTAAPAFDPQDSIAGKQPLSLLDLPQTEEGEIVLTNGFYEADFKSYCLQPGTPSPTARDAYLQAPIKGYRKEIVATILSNSRKKTWLPQRNIQLLLWSVVSGSGYNRLSPDVRNTASQLLSSQQIFELKGGVMGVVKTVASVLPDNPLAGTYRSMQQLFDAGNSSYEAFERIAVQRELSAITKPALKTDQWYKQDGGYFVRYFPASYQQVKIQVYVPTPGADSLTKTRDVLLFNPAAMMAIPVNSNAQRLGIGAAVLNAVIKIIQVERSNPAPAKQPRSTGPKNGKAAS
ncbi:MAG: hypothetical protein JWR61_1677 [Ferruginibacter sp.]|uniref:hypothetical protein n=1 Tax=Ferruginibacter sp. TaxID=1940288 RepID=UPI00265A983B|nr:hypothetical protein [Ferruginibacter sp.]MDB5276722.1 hypothetical protein [Ferruginibacter sp.]